jgi:hypothetical protein
MNNEVKQTAVEWYAQRLYDLEIAYNQGVINTDVYIQSKIEAKQQAKEMEEVQIINAYTQGQYDGDNIREGDAYEYYNLIYGDTK